jgi:GNAT superfamily N-acetyltransferase
MGIPNLIHKKLQNIMSDLWWATPSMTVINNPDICYSLDLNNCWNNVWRINANSGNLETIVEEVAGAHRSCKSKFYIFSEQLDRMTPLLSSHGYQFTFQLDMRYRIIEGINARPKSNIATKIVTDKESLIQLLKVESQAFGIPFQPGQDSDLEHLIKEYRKPEPRAVRILAYDKTTGEALGTGGMSLFENEGVCLFFAGGTIPSARNRGVYSALIDARLQYAKQRGISVAGVFARQTSSSPIVAKQGFLKCGEMFDWVRFQNSHAS